MKKLTIFLCISIVLGFQAVHSEGQNQPGSGANPWGGGANPWGGGGGSFFDNAMSSMDSAFSDSDMTPQDSYYLGRAVAANILATYRPYNGNPELTRYLNRICMTIAINSSEPAQFNGYHVLILDTPEFNAFATPGGHIFITKGLVEATTSEDMLAALIAHELAHIILKHGEAIIKDMSLTNEMAAIAGQAAALAGNSQAAQRVMLLRNSVAATIDTMVKNGYSQPQEYAADTQALALLAASGYSPGALVELLQVLQRVQSSQSGGFNSTHPTPAQRISNIQGAIARYQVQDTRSFRVPRFRNR